MNEACDPVIEVDEALHEVTVAHGVGRFLMAAPPAIRAARAGQYVLVRSLRPGAPPLGRPLSIMRAGDRLELMFNIVGTGTRLFAEAMPGEVLQIVGPLGQPFALPDGPVTIIGDASHVGTTLALARERGAEGLETRVLFIADALPTGQHHPATDLLVAEFGATGAPVTLVSTADIEAAIVADAPAMLAAGASDAIMAVVQDVAARHGIAGAVALQAPMACGLGVCQVCVRRFHDGALHIICENPIVDLAAPVFDGASGTHH